MREMVRVGQKIMDGFREYKKTSTKIYYKNRLIENRGIVLGITRNRFVISNLVTTMNPIRAA